MNRDLPVLMCCAKGTVERQNARICRTCVEKEWTHGLLSDIIGLKDESTIVIVLVCGSRLQIADPRDQEVDGLALCLD